MMYDAFPLYRLPLRAYTHPQHPDQASRALCWQKDLRLTVLFESLDLKPQYLRHFCFIHVSADLNSAEIGLYKLREPCDPMLEPKPLP